MKHERQGRTVPFVVLLGLLGSLAAFSLSAWAQAPGTWKTTGSMTGKTHIGLPAASRSAGSLTFAVNSTADLVDANIGDGLCAAANGLCTLRAAIQEANADPGGDVITLPSGTYTLTITGANEEQAATGDLDVTDTVNIVGASQQQTIIRAASGFGDRVFHLMNGATVRISGLSIENGHAVCCGSGYYWGGGAIYNDGASLYLSNASIRSNTSDFIGGGVYNTGFALLTSVVVQGNSSSYDGGIRNEGTIQFFGGAIVQNSVCCGTGGMSNYGTAKLTDVAVSHNTSGGDSGGIWNAAVLMLNRDTFVGNTSQTYGGALSVWEGTASLFNVTITGNSAGDGGGISNLNATSTLVNVTVDGNGAPVGGNIENQNGIVTLYSTIVADSTSGDNCVGLIGSRGYNLDSQGACQFSQVGDLSGVDPLLGQLARNGGKTETQALSDGSPAIDHIPPENCKMNIDQRGVPRPQGVGCDIGAFEKSAQP